MRNTKTIDIFKGDEKRQIIVKELTVKEIRNFWQNHTDTILGQGMESFDGMKPFFEVCVSGISWEELEDTTPSELKKLYTAFKDVNAVFFEVAKAVEGENPILVQSRVIVGRFLMNKFVSLSKPVIETHGTTDTDSL